MVVHLIEIKILTELTKQRILSHIIAVNKIKLWLEVKCFNAFTFNSKCF